MTKLLQPYNLLLKRCKIWLNFFFTLGWVLVPIPYKKYRFRRWHEPCIHSMFMTLTNTVCLIPTQSIASCVQSQCGNVKWNLYSRMFRLLFQTYNQSEFARFMNTTRLCAVKCDLTCLLILEIAPVNIIRHSERYRELSAGWDVVPHCIHNTQDTAFVCWLWGQPLWVILVNR